MSSIPAYSRSTPSEYSSTPLAGTTVPSNPPAYSTESKGGGTLTHTTAFIIEPITGPTIFTTMTPRGAGHSK